jgi:hypothetical protein
MALYQHVAVNNPEATPDPPLLKHQIRKQTTIPSSACMEREKLGHTSMTSSIEGNCWRISICMTIMVPFAGKRSRKGTATAHIDFFHLHPNILWPTVMGKESINRFPAFGYLLLQVQIFFMQHPKRKKGSKQL